MPGPFGLSPATGRPPGSDIDDVTDGAANPGDIILVQFIGLVAAAVSGGIRASPGQGDLDPGLLGRGPGGHETARRGLDGRRGTDALARRLHPRADRVGQFTADPGVGRDFRGRATTVHRFGGPAGARRPGHCRGQTTQRRRTADLRLCTRARGPCVLEAGAGSAVVRAGLPVDVGGSVQGLPLPRVRVAGMPAVCRAPGK